MSQYAFDHPNDAITAMGQRLLPVGVELGCEDLIGRVLAEPIYADRDSPAADVSAMDGYAVYPGQLTQTGELDVIAECVPGAAPPNLTDLDNGNGGVIRIFTGAVIPQGCDRVIQREHTLESPTAGQWGTIQWTDQARTSQPGQNIRRQGENLREGETALTAGTLVRAPHIAALANFGVQNAMVHNLVRVAIITTGDELVDDASGPLPPWQIRNSNSLTLASLIDTCPYTVIPTLANGPDAPAKLQAIIEEAIATHDIVLLTGGVSMGDHDYVPTVLETIGAETIFHKLPLRPGRPILGAFHQAADDAACTPILGLPGNPVSATMGAVRFAMPLIAKLAGITAWKPNPPTVTLTEIGNKTLPLHWMRAVRMTGPGEAELVIGKGSGDLVSLAQSDGFIEMPAGANDLGPWPFFAWN